MHVFNKNKHKNCKEITIKILRSGVHIGSTLFILVGGYASLEGESNKKKYSTLIFSYVRDFVRQDLWTL